MIGYQPRKNYDHYIDERHDHLCRCPGCNYDGPEPTDEEVLEMEIKAQARDNARKVMDMPEERFVPNIPVDEIIHTNEQPFCDDPKCPCHGCSTWEDIDRQIDYLAKPFDDGLLTVSEKDRLFWGRQV